MPVLLKRIAEEWRLAPSGAARRELDRLRVRRSPDDEDELVVGYEGEPLGALPETPLARTVRIGRGVYAHVPTSHARVELLAWAKKRARAEIVVHVPTVAEGGHAGRLVFDFPRRALRSLGGVFSRLPEPGDRHEGGHFVHCFFDDEAWLAETATVGLTVRSRQGHTFILEPSTSSGRTARDETAASFAREIARVAAIAARIERARRVESPERALAKARDHGGRQARRGPIGRARLRRAVGWVDALFPAGPNCYRRVLLESALDAAAARETVVLGLDVGATGHAAFKDSEERTFDVVFEIAAHGP